MGRRGEALSEASRPIRGRGSIYVMILTEIKLIHTTKLCANCDQSNDLTVDDGQLHSDGQPLPVLGVFLDVLSNFLGGQTQRSQLGGQSGRVSYLTPDRPKDHILCLT